MLVATELRSIWRRACGRYLADLMRRHLSRTLANGAVQGKNAFSLAFIGIRWPLLSVWPTQIQRRSHTHTHTPRMVYYIAWTAGKRCHHGDTLPRLIGLDKIYIYIQKKEWRETFIMVKNHFELYGTSLVQSVKPISKNKIEKKDEVICMNWHNYCGCTMQNVPNCWTLHTRTPRILESWRGGQYANAARSAITHK